MFRLKSSSCTMQGPSDFMKWEWGAGRNFYKDCLKQSKNVQISSSPRRNEWINQALSLSVSSPAGKGGRRGGSELRSVKSPRNAAFQRESWAACSACSNPSSSVYHRKLQGIWLNILVYLFSNPNFFSREITRTKWPSPQAANWVMIKRDEENNYPMQRSKSIHALVDGHASLEVAKVDSHT